MNDNMEMTPELTLEPTLETAAAVAEAPELTLDPTVAEKEVKQADQAMRDANAVRFLRKDRHQGFQPGTPVRRRCPEEYRRLF